MDERLFYKCVQRQVHFTDKRDPSACAHSGDMLPHHSEAPLCCKDLWYITDVAFVRASAKAYRRWGWDGVGGDWL